MEVTLKPIPCDTIIHVGSDPGKVPTLLEVFMNYKYKWFDDDKLVVRTDEYHETRVLPYGTNTCWLFRDDKMIHVVNVNDYLNRPNHTVMSVDDFITSYIKDETPFVHKDIWNFDGFDLRGYLSDMCGKSFYSILNGKVKLVYLETADTSLYSLKFVSVNDPCSTTIRMKNGKWCDEGNHDIWPSEESFRKFFPDVKMAWDDWKENVKSKMVSYDDICEDLFKEGSWQDDDVCDICWNEECNPKYRLNCVSEDQIWLLYSINKLMNVRKFIEKDWTPDWGNTSEPKWYPLIGMGGKIEIKWDSSHVHPLVFSSEENVKKMIDIIGEDEVKKILHSKY